ncbi:MAG: hypothetical protein HY815_22815 [Candidatus Riflebacteria bacterium]|nr:hypothetical protein [Candidatus Riflebacteria bacterium]
MRRGLVGLFWIALVAITVVRSFALFPSVAQALSDEPLMNADYPFHAYQAAIGVRFFGTRWADWGYDPYFLAGYPKSPHYDGSVLPFEVVTAVVPGLFRAQKVLVLVTPLLTLGLTVIGLRGFGLSPAAVRIGALLSVALFWLSLSVVFLLLAMTSGVIGVGLALASLGALHRAVTGGPWWPFLALAPFAANCHPHALLVLGLGTVCLFAWTRPMPVRVMAWVALWLAVVSLPYLVPYLSFMSVADPERRTVYWALARPNEPVRYYFNMDDGARQAGILELVLLVVAILGIRRWGRENDRLRAGMFGATVVALFLFTFYGSLSRAGAAIQPLRLTTFLAFLTLVPASSYLACILEPETPQPASPKASEARWFMGTAGVVIAGLVVHGTVSLAGLLRVGLDRADRELIGWIDRVARPDARVLIEDAGVGGPLGGDELSGGGVLPLVPLYTGRAVIGGPTAWVYIRHRFANACDGELFGRPARESTGLAGLLDRYNVGTLFVWSADAYRAVRALPGVRPLGAVGRLVGFARAPAGYARVGSATVRATWDRIDVEEARPVRRRLVLSFHHDGILEVDPPARLHPVAQGDDPVPFIMIEDPPARFTIKAGRSTAARRGRPGER